MNVTDVTAQSDLKSEAVKSTGYDLRWFVFLQGPHGPFFSDLSKSVKASGVKVSKIGFNEGDRFFWRDKSSFVAYTQPMEDWPAYIDDYLARGVTDIVLYGDTRPVHAAAKKTAKRLGIRVHCFEEGYLRPYWVTYERDGVNGHSRLMEMTIPKMREALKNVETDLPEAPAKWGDMRQHILLGAVYHWHILFRNHRFKNYKTHRDSSVRHEFWLHLKRLITRPSHVIARRRATRAIKRNGFVYHLGLLQLSHDSSIRSHSDFTSMGEFMRICVRAFAKKAPKHHHLVFKAHPLEDDRQPLAKITLELAQEFGLDGRIHFVRGGKLAELLDFATSVVTINSTAAQQALWRGLPVRALGTGVFCKPELTSEQSLDDFFAAPKKPDVTAYHDFRQYLLITSQITGGFYSRKSRIRLVRKVVDMLLSEQDPYDAVEQKNEAPMQQLRVVNWAQDPKSFELRQFHVRVKEKN